MLPLTGNFTQWHFTNTLIFNVTGKVGTKSTIANENI